MPVARASTHRSPTKFRKRQIVEIVLNLVAERGAEAVSAQLVADVLGLSQPAVFRHFPSKEAMWLAVMDWLEEQLIAIYSAAGADDDEAGLITLSRMFLAHIKLIERYPALAKLVFSDHLRQQYPALRARFGEIHKAYTTRLRTLIDSEKSVQAVAGSVDSAAAAATFLSLVQGLGFQFAIAQLGIKLLPEAERALCLYIQAVTASVDQAQSARAIVAAARRKTLR